MGDRHVGGWRVPPCVVPCLERESTRTDARSVRRQASRARVLAGRRRWYRPYGRAMRVCLRIAPFDVCVCVCVFVWRDGGVVWPCGAGPAAAGRYTGIRCTRAWGSSVVHSGRQRSESSVRCYGVVCVMACPRVRVFERDIFNHRKTHVYIHRGASPSVGLRGFMTMSISSL